jgi:SAM-dependent methyltransferase
MLHCGTDEQFGVLREFLRTRYSEEIVSAAMGIPRIADFDKRDPRQPIRDTLVRFFFGGAAVPIGEFHQAVPGPALDAMRSLGLIERSGADRVFCPLILYPTHGLFLISDRFMGPDGQPASGDREFVYFALTANTQSYFAMLPERPCEAFLDVGAGCGAAALAQAQWARTTSCATDISERSTEFARFNARLNGVTNVECLQGSLLEPVEGRTFDRIGCHPPYDLSSSSPWTFADGGADGEFVIRGTIAGLPAHLAPGGEFFALFRGGDREGQPLESRIREWLGERNQDFDIALVVRGIVPVQDYVIGSILSTSHDFKLYETYVERFRELRVEQLVYSSLLIRRKTQAGTPLTLRRQAGVQCTAAELEWLLDWETALPQLDMGGTIIMAAPDAELTIRHRPANGEMRPANYRLRANTPFTEELECPEWVAMLVSQCAAPKPSEQLFNDMRQQSPLNAEQFSAAVKRLVSAGVLRISDARGPAPIA